MDFSPCKVTHLFCSLSPLTFFLPILCPSTVLCVVLSSDWHRCGNTWQTGWSHFHWETEPVPSPLPSPGWMCMYSTRKNFRWLQTRGTHSATLFCFWGVFFASFFFHFLTITFLSLFSSPPSGWPPVCRLYRLYQQDPQPNPPGHLWWKETAG